MSDGILCSPDLVQIGADSAIDPGVLIGYRTGRVIAETRLVIGASARLRSGTVIYAGSSFGANLETGHNVVIREQVSAGDRLQVWNSSTVDYGCTIGHGVKLHTNVYLAQYSVLEDDVFIAPGVSVANDLHPGREYSRKRMRGPHLRRGAQIGVNVTLLPYVTVGEGAMIGAGSVVSRDIPDGMLAYGNPARPVRPVADLGEEDLARWLRRQRPRSDGERL